MIFRLLFNYFVQIPLRFKRLTKHLMAFRLNKNWWIEWAFFILDLTPVPELLQIFHFYFKKSARRLNEREIQVAKSIFGNAIDFDCVQIDEKARIGTKKYNIAYVSFQIINSWGELSDDLLIHELTHVWQYQRLGAVYIPRALAAQNTTAGYNYGGVEYLFEELDTPESTFLVLNLEQQADFLQDYFLIQNGYLPQWGMATREDKWVYESHLKNII